MQYTILSSSSGTCSLIIKFEHWFCVLLFFLTKGIDLSLLPSTINVTTLKAWGRGAGSQSLREREAQLSRGFALSVAGQQVPGAPRALGAAVQGGAWR